MSKYKINSLSKSIAYAALISGSGSMILFTVFLYMGSFSFWNFGLSDPMLLLVDAGLCMGFFIQHSTMLRKWFQNRVLKFIPGPYYGAFYAIASSIALFSLLIFWQKSSVYLVSASGAYRLLPRMLFLLSIAGFIWSTRALGAFDPFGAKTIFYHAGNRQPKSLPLMIRGPYKLVRHPLYFFSLMMIWSCPDISMDRLMFNLLWTGWIIIGTLLEERDLVLEFGAAYREYQEKVPMLIPFIKSNQNT